MIVLRRLRALSTHPPPPAAKAGWSSGPPPRAQSWRFVVPVKPDQSGLDGGEGEFGPSVVGTRQSRPSKALAPSKPILAQAGRELGMLASCVLAWGQGWGQQVAEQGKGGVDRPQNDGYKTKEHCTVAAIGINQWLRCYQMKGGSITYLQAWAFLPRPSKLLVPIDNNNGIPL
jgi:hypothetical protein